MNLNKVMLIGRLTRDPEIRNTQSGQTVASVSIATNRYWTKDGQKQEQTEFHNIVLWGRLAEITGQYLTKGQEAYFEGRLQTRTYTDKAGVERRITEIVAENMQMGSRPQGQGSQGAYTPPSQATPQVAEKPQSTTAPEDTKPEATTPGTATTPSTANPATPASEPAKEEEIPTINLDDEPEEEVKVKDVPF